MKNVKKREEVLNHEFIHNSITSHKGLKIQRVHSDFLKFIYLYLMLLTDALIFRCTNETTK